jgi:DNA-binding CsgD family transcriptional regulator
MTELFLDESWQTTVDPELYCPIRRKYYLGPGFPDVYLTQREAECVYWIISGLTNQQAADQMQLSPRTIEYYLRNVRCKLNCYSKAHLVKLLQHAAFLPMIEQQIHEHEQKQQAAILKM